MIRKTKKLWYVVVFFPILLASSETLSQYIYPNALAKYGSLIISLLLLILLVNKKNESFEISKYESLWIISILFIVINKKEVPDTYKYGYAFVYFFMVSFIILSKKTCIWIRSYLKISAFIYGIYAFFTILFLFTPSFYKNYVVNIFQANTREFLIYLYNRGSMSGLTGHYSTNGCYLALGNGIIWSIYICNRKKKYLFFGIYFFIALLLTTKRAHNLFFLIATLIVYYIYMINQKVQIPITISFSILLFGFSFWFLAQYIPLLKNLLSRFSTVIVDDESLIRILYWKEGFRIFKTSPIFGVGWNGFRYYGSPSIVGDVIHGINDAHNVYIQLLCETGIVGFIFYVWLFWSSCYKTALALFQIRKFQNNDFKKYEIPLAISLNFQIFFILYCTTGNPLYDFLLFIPYMFACGISVAVRRELFLIQSTGYE